MLRGVISYFKYIFGKNKDEKYNILLKKLSEMRLDLFIFKKACKKVIKRLN